MCRFIETICIEDGQILNLPRHQQRVDSTRRHYFGQMPRLNLGEHIRNTGCGNGRIRCRVTYGADIQNIEYFPYHIRSVKTLKPVECDSMEYSYKYADRSALDSLFTRRGEADDILIVRNGLLTDTSIANIALWDGRQWHTPARPLLKGTRRAELLDNGILTEHDIPVEKIWTYRKIRLFNAMLHFGEIELPCADIQRPTAP